MQKVNVSVWSWWQNKIRRKNIEVLYYRLISIRFMFKILPVRLNKTPHNCKADEPEVLVCARVLTEMGLSRKLIVGQAIIDIRYHIHTKEQQQMQSVAVVEFLTGKGFTVTVRICRILHWVIYAQVPQSLWAECYRLCFGSVKVSGTGSYDSSMYYFKCSFGNKKDLDSFIAHSFSESKPFCCKYTCLPFLDLIRLSFCYN